MKSRTVMISMNKNTQIHPDQNNENNSGTGPDRNSGFPQTQTAQDSVFAQEQAHLTDTFTRLRQMEEELENRIGSISEKAAAEKLDIRENLALNFDGDDDSMETLIEFEVMNHAIDHYNIARDAAMEKLGRVKRLLKTPYFAKVQLRYEPGEEPEEYYIGSAGVSENALEPLVIDWRSPVAETYYNQDNGRTFYTVEGRRIDVELLLRRQFNLDGDQLRAFFDTQIALEDPLLIQSLTRQRSDKMQAITATIQKEQNAVVRHENVPVLLVNGIAGSGKTSVLLQRIAWLFYRQRETLRPDEVVLMTLNPIFRRYIDQVLPDMGEMNPVSLTWTDFLSMAGVSKPALSGQKTAGVGRDTLLRMEEKLPALRLEADDLRPIHQKGLQILSRERIAAVLAMHPEIPTGERLVQIAVDELRELARREIRRKERDADREEAADSSWLSSDAAADGQNGRGRGGSSSPDDERRDGGGRAENNRIQSQYGGAFQAINTCQWLDITRIGRRLLGLPEGTRLSAIEWLYLKMLLTGQKDLRTKYVMVDEVQDYTPAQLIVLRRYFPRARFMLLGDEFQAIREGTATFAQIHELFSRTRDLLPRPGRRRKASPAGGIAQAGTKAAPPNGVSPVTELLLTTSYRSSPEITALFAGLLPPEKQILVSSVQPSGNTPVFCACGTRDEYLRRLAQSVRDAAKEEGLTAILCAGTRSMEKTAAILREYPDGRSTAGSASSSGAAAATTGTGSVPVGSMEIPVLRAGGSLPESGVFFITLAHAKGLEFDGVIIPDAGADTYPDTPLSRHRLYTALSRATRRLTVLSRGEMTPLLPENNAENQDHTE